MRKFRTIMVCLDLSEMDEILIRYTAYFSRAFSDVEKVIFTHNIRFDYPEDAEEVLSEIDKPLKELLYDIVSEKIAPTFPSGEDHFETEVLIEEEESSPRVLARMAKEKNVDLTIAGKKLTYKGSGLSIEMLLRISDFNAALLLVPETAYHQITDILLPTDFSKASKPGLEVGFYLKKELDAKLECQHVYNIPVHYFPYIAVDNLQAKMKKEAVEEWEEFSEKIPEIRQHDLQCAFTFSRGNNVSQTIYNYALRQKKDLILVNTKGKGALTSFVIGSVANRLIQHDLHVPLLVVKG